MITWHRDDNTFARRVEHSDLQGFIKRGFIIEQGTKALFFENGHLQEVVRAGRIEFGGILDKLLTLDFRRHVEVVVCDAGDIQFAYLFGAVNAQTGQLTSRVRSADGIALQVGVDFVLQLASPQLFYLNVFKGRSELPLLALKGRYFKETLAAIAEFVAGYNVKDLRTGHQFKNVCADAVEKHLRTSLERDGFRLLQVRSLSFYNPEIAELIEQKTCIKVEKQRQELEFAAREIEISHRERWITLRHRERELETAEHIGEKQDALKRKQAEEQIALQETAHDVEHYHKQAELWQKLRRAEVREQMAKLTTEDETAAFVDEMDNKKVLRREQKETLRRELREHRDDHERKRAFVNARIDMEHEYALKGQKLAAEQDLDQRQFASQLERERRELEHRLDSERKKWAENLDRRKTEAEIDAIDLESQKKRVQFAMGIQEQHQEMKRCDEHERQKMEMEKQQFDQQLKLQEMDAQFVHEKERRVLEREDKREQYRHVESLKKMETEANIVAGERDAVLAETQAQSAGKDALIQEKERQLAMQAQFQHTLLEQGERSAERMAKLVDRTLGSAERIAAGKPGAMNNDLHSPMQSPGAAPVGKESDKTPLRICTACGMEVDTAVKHCANCGNELC